MQWAYIYIYIYTVCLPVCVCVYLSAMGCKQSPGHKCCISFLSSEIWSSVLYECFFSCLLLVCDRVTGWTQCSYFTEKSRPGNTQSLDSLPPYQNSTTPALYLSAWISTSCCFSILFFSPFLLFIFTSFCNPAILVDGENRQYRGRFDLLCRALQGSWHCMTWTGSLDRVHQMASALDGKLRCQWV